MVYLVVAVQVRPGAIQAQAITAQVRATAVQAIQDPAAAIDKKRHLGYNTLY